MTKSFDELQSYFANASVRDLAIKIAHGVNGTSVNEFTAIYARFLDLAFHDKTTSHNDRALAACWAKVVESIISITMEDRPDVLTPFVKARNASLEHAVEWGYGSVGYIACHEPSALGEKIFAPDDEKSLRNEEHDRSNFLLSIAFGRQDDSSKNL